MPLTTNQTPDGTLTTKRIAEALHKVADAASGALEAVRLFQQATEKMEQVLNDAKRMPHSDSPLLLSQFVVEGVKNALQMQRAGLAILPSLSDLQAPPATNEIILTDEEVRDKFIGPLNDSDVLRAGDWIFLHRNRAGNRLFRSLSAESWMVGKKMADTPFTIIYRAP